MCFIMSLFIVKDTLSHLNKTLLRNNIICSKKVSLSENYVTVVEGYDTEINKLAILFYFIKYSFDVSFMKDHL
jgi:hypothetical protein